MLLDRFGSQIVERLEDRQLMSASGITVVPPPSDALVAVVVALSPQETQTGRPLISVTVNPPPVIAIPDKAPPKVVHQEIVIVKLVDKSSPNL